MSSGMMPRVQSQLTDILDEYAAARDRFGALRQAVPAARWHERVNPASWSVAECIAHLNLTSKAYEALVPPALQRARELQARAPDRYGRGFLGWVLWRTMGPPVRMRFKTVPAFVPSSEQPVEQLVTEWETWHEVQVRWVHEADGLPLGDVEIQSPFESRVHYNLFAALSILPRHQLRHLWQAERAWATVKESRA